MTCLLQMGQEPLVVPTEEMLDSASRESLPLISGSRHVTTVSLLARPTGPRACASSCVPFLCFLGVPALCPALKAGQ